MANFELDVGGVSWYQMLRKNPGADETQLLLLPAMAYAPYDEEPDATHDRIVPQALRTAGYITPVGAALAASEAASSSLVLSVIGQSENGCTF